MSRITTDIVKSLRKSLQASDRKTSAYDTQATIRRIEDGVAWVHIPGGVDETPVQLTINAKEGDQVQVRVSGGRAFLVGNATAPPTDDSYAKRMSKSLSGDLKGTKKTLRGLGRVVEMVKDIASNTNQYFWHTETGSDTGAHITEIPQEEFLADPEHGGGNLLARSNGVAVRDGLDELSVFSAEGVRIGRASEGHMEITDHEIRGMGERGMHFDVVGPVYSDTAEADTRYWSRSSATGYTGYPSYDAGSEVMLVKFGKIESGSSVHIELDYYYNSSTQNTFSANFVGGTSDTVSNGNLFSVVYEADTDTVSMIVNDGDVHFSNGYASASQTYKRTNKLQLVFGEHPSDYEGGDCSTTLGTGSKANGRNSLAAGNNCLADGNESQALGFETVASGEHSYTEGYCTETDISGYAAHAEGWRSKALEDAAHAEGYYTTASGEYSHAEGRNTVASGEGSHAEGRETEATDQYTHASGWGTVADSAEMTAVGRFNVRNSTHLFAVGNGNSDSQRSDAFSVDPSGNATVQETLFANDISATVERISLSRLISVSSANATLIEGGGVRFGKTVQIYIKWKTVNAITVPASGNITNILVGTILLDYLKPILLTAAHSNGDLAGGAAWYTIHPTGEIYLGACDATGAQRTIAADSEFSIMATYIAN